MGLLLASIASPARRNRRRQPGGKIQNFRRDVVAEDGAAEDRSSMRSPMAAATPRWPRRKRSMCRWSAKLVCCAAKPHQPRPGGKVLYERLRARLKAYRPGLPASEDAEKVLDIFRANDDARRGREIYTIAAADILHKDRGETKARTADG